MKFLLIAALVAVAAAVPVHRGLVTPGIAGPAPIVELDQQPIAIGPAIIDSFEPIAVGPAIIDGFEPIAVGPAIIDTETSPISVGPAIIDFPLPDGGAVAEVPAVVEPSPVVVGELEAGQASPLVQIIVNVNQASVSPVGVAPTPVESAVVDAAEPIIVVDQAAEPVHVVDQAAEPVHVVDQVAEPVIVVDTPTVLEPVQVVEPVVVAPVIIGTPIIPAPAVVLPETLN